MRQPGPEKNARIPVELQPENDPDGDFLVGCELLEPSLVHAKDGTPLHLIASMSLQAIAKTLQIEPPEDKRLAGSRLFFFSSYSEEDYFLDDICYHGTEEEAAIFTDGFTQGIVADAGTYGFGESQSFTLAQNTTATAGSFLGGEPEFLQNEYYPELNGFHFIGQILGYDLPKSLENLFYFPESIGYFFIKEDFSEGRFFVQAT